MSATRSSSRRSSRGTGAQLLTALRAMLLVTVVVGLVYPLVVTGIAQVALPHRADGSLLERDGQVVGSRLVGQAVGPAGDQDPRYFWPRPSAAGDGYDGRASGASNLAQDSPDLLAQVQQRRREVAAADGTDPADVPPDALLASASGLDPDISPAYAAQQVARVARARGLQPSQVRALVAEHTTGRTLGFLGEPRVAVLPLNLALDEVADGGRMSR